MQKPSIRDEKRQLRANALAAQKAFEAPPKAGQTLRQQLEPWTIGAKGGDCWALFASLPWEIDLAPLDEELRRKGVRRLFPTMAGDALVFREVSREVGLRDLPVGPFSVPTPSDACPAVALSSCPIVITPGLLFGKDGRRLGYGRGFYDRALAQARLERPNLCAIGVGFDHQLVETVPTTPTDEFLTAIATPARVVRPPATA